MTAPRVFESASDPPRETQHRICTPAGHADASARAANAGAPASAQRVLELEAENHRLRLLVADLIVKNQRLREIREP